MISVLPGAQLPTKGGGEERWELELTVANHKKHQLQVPARDHQVLISPAKPRRIKYMLDLVVVLQLPGPPGGVCGRDDSGNSGEAHY